MKEDQTQLMTARLEHLQFLMKNGRMPMFCHRSDILLFAMEAYNIARGLSSRYYRMLEDLDIRFFVRFDFNTWLEEIQRWIEQLGSDEYHVEDKNDFAEGRAKRLTIVVDRLFGYNLDKLPDDSAEGSMALPKEEIFEPFKAITGMKSSDMVALFSKSLQEIHKYLLKLSMLPVEWSDEDRRKALRLYLEDSRQRAKVQTELDNYKYFAHIPGNATVKSQFCYLKQRLYVLAANNELAELSIAPCDQEELLIILSGLFGKDEFNPTADQIPAKSKPMADDELFAKFLYFVNLDDVAHFPVLDEDKVSYFFISKDTYLTHEQEENMQRLFALMEAMRAFFDPVLEKRNKGGNPADKMQERINELLDNIKRYNKKLESLLDYHRQIEELDAFFENLFSPKWREDYIGGQRQLLTLLEKGRTGIKAEPYVHLLREANDTLRVFKKQTAFGKHIYECLAGEDLVSDINDASVNDYYTKQAYKNAESWDEAIELVEAVEKEMVKA